MKHLRCLLCRGVNCLVLLVSLNYNCFFTTSTYCCQVSVLFTRNKTLNGIYYSQYQEILENYTSVRTRIKCSVYCMLNPKCLHFAFNDVFYDCSIYSGYSMTGTLLGIAGWKTYHLEANLAYKKQTWQSTNYDNQRFSDKAVDGIKSSNGYIDCTHTKQEDNPYWYVDLRVMSDIFNVVVLNRANSYGYRFHKVNVTVAGENKIYDKSCGFFQGPGSDGETIKFDCPKDLYGRYVKIQIMAASSILHLCEVEVFGRAKGPC